MTGVAALAVGVGAGAAVGAGVGAAGIAGATGAGAAGVAALAVTGGGSGGGLAAETGGGVGAATGAGAAGVGAGAAGAAGTIGFGAAAALGTGVGAVSGLTPASACVDGSDGGRAWCGTGSMPPGSSTFWLSTKTFAAGLATITRAGGGTMRPEDVRNSAAGFGSTTGGTGRGAALGVEPAGGLGRSAVIGGGTGSGGTLTAGGGGVAPSVGTLPAGGFTGKRGVVLAVGGAPVSGGAAGRGGVASVGGGVGGGVGFAEMLGIGLVTAVDHAGGTPGVDGAGSSWLDVCMGNVVAAETLGRGVGVTFPVAGFNGRGGRLIRSVSRFGAFGSLPSGVESAIIMRFYRNFLKCSMAKFAMATDLCS